MVYKIVSTLLTVVTAEESAVMWEGCECLEGVLAFIV